jgi:hypothetical protein
MKPSRPASSSNERPPQKRPGLQKYNVSPGSSSHHTIDAASSDERTRTSLPLDGRSAAISNATHLAISTVCFTAI